MTGVEEVVREDPRWQEAMRKRGVTDFDLAMIDPWPAGYYGAQDHYDNSPLVCRPLTFMRAAPSEHGYARPVEGLIVTFDLDAMKVIDIEDHGVVPLPPTAGNYDEKFMFDENNRPAFTEFRDDVKPIEITQPDGPSFTVDGWKVQWQKWSMRIGFNPREGIVLHEITYTDRGETRPIVYRASLSEMVVPVRRYGTHALEQERLRHGRSRDGLLGQSVDTGLRLPRRDPLLRRHGQRLGGQRGHDPERDLHARGGLRDLLEAHRFPDRGGRGAPVPAAGDLDDLHRRQLRVRVLLVLLQRRLDGGRGQALRCAHHRCGARRRRSRGGARWSRPNIYGPNHQHFFNFRLDMSVDGAGNSVYEVDSIPEPDPALNPHRNAWITRDTLVASEADGARDWDWSTGRYWKVTNPSKTTNSAARSPTS